MKAMVDHDSCIGCGACAGVCPEVFEMQDDGTSVAANEVTPELEGAAQDAIDGCPVNAIVWDD